jgi:hypothetical protein
MSDIELSKDSFELFLIKNKNKIIENINVLTIFLLHFKTFEQNNMLISTFKKFINTNFPNDLDIFIDKVYLIVNNYIIHNHILEILLNHDIIEISKINLCNYFDTNKDTCNLTNNKLDYTIEETEGASFMFPSRGDIFNILSTRLFINNINKDYSLKEQNIYMLNRQYDSLNFMFNVYKKNNIPINIPKVSICLLLKGLTQNSYECYYTTEVILGTEFGKLLDLIKDNYGDWHPDTSYIVIKNNFSVDVLKYFLKKGCPIHPQSLQLAMQKDMYYHADFIIQKQDTILYPTKY